MPNLRIVANPFVKRYGRSDSVAWTLPIDDTTTKIFTLYRTPRGERVSRARFNGKSWAELTDPLGVTFDPAHATVKVEAGNFILEPAR